MIRCHHCIEAQTWATWALASLTHREEKGGKYIGLTIEEGGYEVRVYAKSGIFRIVTFYHFSMVYTLFEALQDLVNRNQASPFILNKVRFFSFKTLTKTSF